MMPPKLIKVCNLSARPDSNTLQVSTSPETIYGGCAASSPIKDGVVSFVDGDGSVLKATFSNCDHTWTYNGDPLDV